MEPEGFDGRRDGLAARREGYGVRMGRGQTVIATTRRSALGILITRPDNGEERLSLVSTA